MYVANKNARGIDVDQAGRQEGYVHCDAKSFPPGVHHEGIRNHRRSRVVGGENRDTVGGRSLHLISRQLERRKQPSQYPYGRLEDADRPRLVERQVVADPVP